MYIVQFGSLWTFRGWITAVEISYWLLPLLIANSLVVCYCVQYPVTYRCVLIDKVSLPAGIEDHSEMWSIGVTLYHVATGQLPFQPFGGRNNRSTMSVHLSRYLLITRGRTVHVFSRVFTGLLNSLNSCLDFSGSEKSWNWTLLLKSPAFVLCGPVSDQIIFVM